MTTFTTASVSGVVVALSIDVDVVPVVEEEEEIPELNPPLLVKEEDSLLPKGEVIVTPS